MTRFFCRLAGLFLAALLVPAAVFAEEGKPPGVVIHHVPAKTRNYVGSPSIAVLPDGSYVASHDYFGKGPKSNRTAIFQSRDQGKTWAPIAELKNQFWSNLFVHQEALYIMGTSAGMGKVIIRRSTDGGHTWTQPRDEHTGVLLSEDHYHTAPMPVVIHEGRIWRAMETHVPVNRVRRWLNGRTFHPFVMSAPIDANLLEAASWTCTNAVPESKKWLNGRFRVWREGNMVVSPEKGLWNIIRVDSLKHPEKAAILRVGEDGKTLHFDADKDFIDFPGGSKKFTIHRDPATGLYWTLCNAIAGKRWHEIPTTMRNTLALASSPDLRTWKIRAVVLHHPDAGRHGFQYADWQFDGDDIIFVSRTAYDDGLGGAPRQHDANFLTFHRIQNFRDLPEEVELPKK